MFLNPFTRIAGFSALFYGFAVLLLTAVIAAPCGVNFVGSLNIHVARPMPFTLIFTWLMLGWLSAAAFFYIAGLLFSKSNIRAIDVFGTFALARAPFLIAAPFGLLPGLWNLHPRPDQMPTEVIISLTVFGIICLLVDIWVVIWSYNAFAVSTNVKSKWLFAVVFVISEIVAIVLSASAAALLPLQRPLEVKPVVVVDVNLDPNDTTLEGIAERFFVSIVEGKAADSFQQFKMDEAMRSWIQEGKYKSVGKTIRQMYGGVGELRKKKVIQPTELSDDLPQIQFVELFYTGKTNSFKTRVSFQGDQIIGIRLFPWTDEQDFGGTPIQLETPTGTIYGTLLEPEQATKPVPVVLLLAGSGPTDRECNQPASKTNAYRMIAEALQQNGIASVRFDKRGVGASVDAGTDESKLRFEHLVEDALVVHLDLRSPP
jgi:hypothetical protein